MNKAQRNILMVALVSISLVSCGGGYTQDEVDELVADAVEQAIVEQENERVSEEEAQQQAAEAARQASLVSAVASCSPSEYITVDAAGLAMEGRGDESAGASVEDIVCVLDALDIPDSVLTRISNTNSTMGLVQGSWAEYEAEWSYHPDNGLFVFIVVSE